jgi:hypothetical protein
MPVLGSATGSAPDSALPARTHRLHRPWQELEAFARSFDLATVDDITHRHIPWGAPPASVTSISFFARKAAIVAELHCSYPDPTLDTRTLPLRAAVLLIQALAAWNEEHMGRLPATRDEKERFRALLRSWQRGGGGDGPALVRPRSSSAHLYTVQSCRSCSGTHASATTRTARHGRLLDIDAWYPCLCCSRDNRGR